MAGIPEADVVVVINDGDPYPSTVYPSRVADVIQHRTNHGVGRSKNEALRLLLGAGCSDIFLCEDDIRIVHAHLCDEYIRASERTGILHFNFAFHGPLNKSSQGMPTPRKVVDYGDGISIGLNRCLVGAFSYYREEVLRKCGLIDPTYRNALEHVDHTYRIIREGFHPPFWWFADLAESYRFIDDLNPDLSKSNIRYNRWFSIVFFKINFLINNIYFLKKNGYLVQNVPDVGEQEVDRILTDLKRQHASHDIR
jgi:GT2 family glycosyltransferase